MSSPASLTVRVEARALGALFDERARPSFPQSSRVVDAGLAEYLEHQVRLRPREHAVEIEVALDAVPSDPHEMTAALDDLHAHFEAERARTELELAVNQREGWGFLLRSLPLLVAAIAVAGVLSVYEVLERTAATAALVTALLYLLAITVVWVLLWDPIEKLLFDAYLLRARLRATRLLAGAPVRFVRRAGPGGP